MSMQTAKRAQLPLYKLTDPGHVLTAEGVRGRNAMLLERLCSSWRVRISTSRLVNDFLGHHLGIFVWVYIDDILGFSKDAEEHQRHLDLVHELLQRH